MCAADTQELFLLESVEAERWEAKVRCREDLGSSGMLGCPHRMRQSKGGGRTPPSLLLAQISPPRLMSHGGQVGLPCPAEATP